MSIMINGTLSVQRIQGAKGEFSVAKLDCELGVLNIKDPCLDQYPTGSYRGRFGLTKVYGHGYTARTGCFIVEIRAQVDEYLIFNDDPSDLVDNIALSDEDPLSAPPAAPLPSNAPEPDFTPFQVPVDEFGPLDESEPAPPLDPAAELFGELWPLGIEVQLDPTAIRSDAEGHRKRCQYLKDHGYAFRASSQSWVQKHA